MPGGDPQQVETDSDSIPPAELVQPHSPLEPAMIPDLVLNLVISSEKEA